MISCICILKVDLMSLYVKLSVLLISDHQLSHSLHVLTAALSLLPLSLVTDESLPADLIEQWVAQELKKKEQASQYAIKSQFLILVCNIIYELSITGVCWK